MGTRFLFLDLLALVFPTLIAALLCFLADPDVALRVASLQTGYLIFAWLVLKLHRRYPGDPWLFAARLSYGVFVLVFSFLQVGQIQGLLYADYWFTGPLIDAERLLFGVHPPLWVQGVYHPLLTELMSFIHLAYYAMPALLVVPLLKQQRRAELTAALSVALGVYVVTYTLYLFLPALNPRTSMQLGPEYVPPSPGYLFWWLEHAIQGDQGTVPGNCFPSGHASGAVIWALLSIQYLGSRHWASIANSLVAVGTVPATVYLGFHHALDPVAGVVLAGACYLIARQLQGRRGPRRLDHDRKLDGLSTGRPEQGLGRTQTAHSS